MTTTIGGGEGSDGGRYDDKVGDGEGDGNNVDDDNDSDDDDGDDSDDDHELARFSRPKNLEPSPSFCPLENIPLENIPKTPKDLRAQQGWG